MFSLISLACLALALFPEKSQAQPTREKDEDSSRIVNGSKAKPGQFPFAVSLQLFVSPEFHGHTCTLSLITTRTCLGAAHCVFDKDKTPIEASRFCGIVGTIKQSMEAKCHKYSEIRWHKAYNPFALINDIATLIFAEEMKLDKKFLDVIPLIAANAIISETTITSIGWGTLHNLEEKSSPTTLRYVKLDIVPSEKCRVIKTQLCISTKGKGVCAGDSGGPNFITRSAKQIQVGISSYVLKKCALDRSVLTAVGPFMKWIKENSVGEPIFVSE